MKKMQGFTLIELMIVITIMALLAAIAIPSYDVYIRKKDLAVAQQELQKIATELERHKAKNFSYKGFSPAYIYPTGSKEGTVNGSVVKIPASNAKYSITITVDDTGLGWSMIAQRADATKGAKLKELRMTSAGERCMNNAGISATSCGTNSEKW